MNEERLFRVLMRSEQTGAKSALEEAVFVMIRRGLDVPLAGRPEPRIDEGANVRRVALLGADCAGARVALQVAPGDRVRAGQSLFVDRRRPAIRFTSPAAGLVEAVNLGPRRRLESVVIALDGSGEAESFPGLPVDASRGLEREALVDLLLRSGLWTALRSRPFERIPDPESEPRALLVSAIDTRPLAAPASLALAGRMEDLSRGLLALTSLTRGSVFACHAASDPLTVPAHPRLFAIGFQGPHPAGLPGTHAHHLAPVDDRGQVWHFGSQETIALGRLLAGGGLETERLVALGGPLVRRRCLVRAPLGSDLDDLFRDRWQGETPPLLVSGSPLDGRPAVGAGGFLGRRDLQACALAIPAPERSAPRSGLLPTMRFEKVFPFALPVVPLLRALQAGDDERAIELGCLELAEEDLALLSHVCPAGLDHGAALRAALDRIERLSHVS